MPFTNQHLLMIELLIRRNEERVAGQMALVEALSGETPQLEDAAEQVLAKLVRIREAYCKDLELIRKELQCK